MPRLYVPFEPKMTSSRPYIRGQRGSSFQALSGATCCTEWCVHSLTKIREKMAVADTANHMGQSTKLTYVLWLSLKQGVRRASF